MNGGKTEDNEGGKKSCAATFECRENDSSVGAMHFARDAPAKCTIAGRENKNELMLSFD